MQNTVEITENKSTKLVDMILDQDVDVLDTSDLAEVLQRVMGLCKGKAELTPGKYTVRLFVVVTSEDEP